MGDELKKIFNADIELIAGSGGVYDVTVDGKKVFSKFDQGRFPGTDEVVTLIKKGE